jgi:hypothetical protein
MAVMGGDNIVVGNKSSIRKLSQTIIGRPPASASAPRADKSSAPKITRQKSLPIVCGEMSQQCGHSGTQSTPQKFLRLVGCRDPNAGPSGKS